MSERLIHLEPPARSADTVVTLCSISLRDIVVSADIGVHPHERVDRQPLKVAVTLVIRQPAADRIDHTIDYNHIVALVEGLAQQRTGLIETFAQNFAAACCQFDGVQSVDVTVEKPRALANGIASTRIILEAV